MNSLGELFKKLRGKKSLREIADVTQLSHTYIADIEKGYRRGSKKPIHPSPDTLKRLAEAYSYPYEELMRVAGYIEGKTDNEENDWDSTPPELTTKDERDIAKDLQNMISNLGKEGVYSQFDGQTIEEIDDEDKELLIASLENSMRLAKRLAKQKFTPKKYRD
ncbi:helix-turn-helix domain-containing protein [Sporosarcina limicola]|uniref:Transcriptional regulator with XRE-family HTH domain n=1 Tax=Sporosarcina limicola TaxID=34101 RepID=A0A927MRC2_9BACL|nr:helix-turn-helix transcriptional regulator [Sporosarcina limicola]MBE1556074.1 transcriptional regulator with XRE-family HTH domain [Sporosarcina limicola]